MLTHDIYWTEIILVRFREGGENMSQETTQRASLIHPTLIPGTSPGGGRQRRIIFASGLLKFPSTTETSKSICRSICFVSLSTIPWKVNVAGPVSFEQADNEYIYI